MENPIDTLSVHAGRFVPPVNASSSPPLYQASSYEFGDLDEVEAIYAGASSGKIYGRYGGPNATQFEAAIAELEGAQAAVGASAGMAAIDAALATSLGEPRALVVGTELYGGTSALFENDYQHAGVRIEAVDQSDLAAVRDALARSGARVLYVEALTNPRLRVADLPALSAIAHEAGAIAIVDATFLTPVLGRPLALGADLVVHSVGKYLGGHGDVGAGVLAGDAVRVAAARDYLVRRGATMPHFEAWLALRGVRTLALRMTRHSENARTLAAWLETHAAVARTSHPSLESHPDRDLAARLYPGGTGGIVAFDLVDASGVAAFLSRLQTIAIVHSLGDVATTISYPRVSSHRALGEAARRAQGIGAGTLRLSAGIESASDLIADLARAFAGLPERLRA